LPGEEITVIKASGAQKREINGAGHIFWISYPEETVSQGQRPVFKIESM
jgi:hypothetical protein